MFDKILKIMQDNIRNLNYVMTVHAQEEMYDDDLSIYDVERSILNGRILERQKDKITGEWKYRIIGKIEGNLIELITKLSITGKLVIITVYKI